MATEAFTPPPETTETERVVAEPRAQRSHSTPAPAAPTEEAARENWLLLSGLVALGGISSIAYYLGFVRPYLLEEYYARPLLDLAKINGVTNSAANSWALAWVVTLLCYFLAFRFAPLLGGETRLFRRTALAIILGWAAVFCATFLFMYPTGAADLFDQIFRARLTTQYGLNPFTTLPGSIQGDPLQPYVAWQGDPSPYGPVWEILAAGASWVATEWLAGDVLWNNLISFKLLVIAAYAGSIFFIYRTLRVWKHEWALRGTLFFAWNPLLLFEIPGNGHNDAVVALFLTWALYLFVTMRHWAVLPVITLAVLTKFVPILMLPIAAAAIWRDRTPRTPGAPRLSNADVIQSLALGVGISGALAISLYAPFWEGPQSIGPLGRQSLFTASIPKVALDWLTINMGVPQASAESLVRWTTLSLVGVVSLALAAWVLRWGKGRPGRGVRGLRYAPQGRAGDSNGAQATDIESEERAGEGEGERVAEWRAHLADREPLIGRMMVASYEVIFVYLALATLWWQPWYLLWLIALAAPLADHARMVRTLLFCAGAVAHYFVWDFLWLWNRSPIREIQITDVLIVYTLPLFYALYAWLRAVQGRGQRAEG